jgi:hypothetical protein
MYPHEVSKIYNSGIPSLSPVKPDEKMNTCVSRAIFKDNIPFIPLF